MIVGWLRPSSLMPAVLHPGIKGPTQQVRRVGAEPVEPTSLELTQWEDEPLGEQVTPLISNVLWQERLINLGVTVAAKQTRPFGTPTVVKPKCSAFPLRVET